MPFDHCQKDKSFIESMDSYIPTQVEHFPCFNFMQMEENAKGI